MRSSNRKTQTVKLFFERDDVSRLTRGKKDTITRKKVKKQKRFLLESPGILHSKFLSEHSIKISYSRFCAFRPFWVRIPTIKDRETCLCKIHENTKLQVEKCKQLNIIQNTNLPTLIGQIAQSKKCMYGECTDCKATRIETNSYDRNEETWWWTWTTKVEGRNIKKKDERDTIKVKMTYKEKVLGCAYDLVTTLEESLVKMKKHRFNINHNTKHIDTYEKTLGMMKQRSTYTLQKTMLGNMLTSRKVLTLVILSLKQTYTQVFSTRRTKHHFPSALFHLPACMDQERSGHTRKRYLSIWKIIIRKL